MRRARGRPRRGSLDGRRLAARGRLRRRFRRRDAPLARAVAKRRRTAICERYGREIQRIAQPKPDSDITAFIAGVAPLWKRQAASIRALRPPRLSRRPSRVVRHQPRVPREVARRAPRRPAAKRRRRAGAALNKVQDSARSAKGLAVESCGSALARSAAHPVDASARRRRRAPSRGRGALRPLRGPTPRGRST